MNYIPHSLIKDIYPRLDINNQPFIRIRLNDGTEYNALTNLCKNKVLEILVVLSISIKDLLNSTGFPIP